MSERAFLQLHVGVQIDLRRLGGLVPEPESNHSLISVAMSSSTLSRLPIRVARLGAAMSAAVSSSLRKSTGPRPCRFVGIARTRWHSTLEKELVSPAYLQGANVATIRAHRCTLTGISRTFPEPSNKRSARFKSTAPLA